jgi:hypothetical protein
MRMFVCCFHTLPPLLEVKRTMISVPDPSLLLSLLSVERPLSRTRPDRVTPTALSSHISHCSGDLAFTDPLGKLLKGALWAVPGCHNLWCGASTHLGPNTLVQWTFYSTVHGNCDHRHTVLFEFEVDKKSVVPVSKLKPREGVKIVTASNGSTSVHQVLCTSCLIYVYGKLPIGLCFSSEPSPYIQIRNPILTLMFRSFLLPSVHWNTFFQMFETNFCINETPRGLEAWLKW